MKQLQLQTQTDDLTPFDFLADEGLQLRPNTLSLDPEEGQDMKIVLPLIKVTDDEATYLASEALLKAYRRLVNLYRADPLLTETPWLYLNLATEAEKRYYVKEMRLVYPNSSDASPLLRSGNAYIEVQLLVHHAAENESSVVALDAVTLSARGNGKTTLPSGYGDTLNRISVASIVSTANPELDHLASWKFWLGIRRAYLGFSNFTPEWDLPYAGTGTNTADATAIGGNYLLFNMTGSPSYARKTTTHLRDITANCLHWIGTYRLLLRQRLSAANMSVSIQAKTGYKNGNVDIPGPLTSISSDAAATNWNLVDLGQITIPPGDYRGMISANPITTPTLADAVGRFKIEIWAELTSGSGDLHLDALYLVPDTHLLIIEGAQLKGSPDTVTVRTFEDDAVQAISNYTSDPYALGESWIDTSIDHEAKAWGLPPEGGMLVFIGQSTRAGGTSWHNDSTNVPQNHDITLNVIERWLGHSEA
jgi:hypothetical protein